jgi:hypothetical protein
MDQTALLNNPLGVDGTTRSSTSMIGKMVDNILKDSEEIYGQDDELSGDDNTNKEPVFKIERMENG